MMRCTSVNQKADASFTVAANGSYFFALILETTLRTWIGAFHSRSGSTDGGRRIM